MPTLKKRAGKSNFALYANEERQIRGAIETLRFFEVNDFGPLGRNSGVLSSGLNAVLLMLGLEIVEGCTQPEPEPCPDDETILTVGDLQPAVVGTTDLQPAATSTDEPLPW